MLGSLYTLATVANLASLGQEVDDPTTRVDVNPTGAGAPGAATVQSLLNWLGQYALWACLAAILAGGGMYAYSRTRGGHGMAVTGAALAAGGGVGTVLVGLGPAIVNSLYQIT